MIVRISIALLITLASAGVGQAQFHHMVEGAAEQRDRVVQTAVEEHELLIDFLIRSEGIDERQVKLLRIAAKGVGEQRAAQHFQDYGGDENVALAKDRDGRFKVISLNSVFLWERSLHKILSEEQFAGFYEAQQLRATGAKATLIERIDRILYLDTDQRTALEALLPKNERASIQALVLPAEIGGTDKAEVRKILSAAQYQVWEAIMQGRFELPPDLFAEP